MTSKNLHTKTRNRLARQDALREYMQERGSVQYLFDIIEKIEKLDPNSETFQQDLATLRWWMYGIKCLGNIFQS
jgi:hypothetical protein